MAGDTRKWWAPIAACPTCNEDADLCPHDQEHDMTSPTQRRHDEILSRLDALIDAVQSTTARDHLHRLLAEETAAERRGEPMDVTEEPPEHEHVWDYRQNTSRGYVLPAHEECIDCGATRMPPEPVYITPDGRHLEPVDVTEEPPVGSQVTDVNGDVWHRRDDIVWRLVAYRDKSGSFGGAPWGHVREFAPLRLTTDADRERVGLPVDTAPDVDPDEALAKVLYARRLGPPETELPRWAPSTRDAYLDMARAARERIEGEMDKCYAKEDAIAHDRAERAESDVARLTRERDDLRARVDELIRERGQAIERYKALRADVERQRDDLPWGSTRLVFSGVLDRDDERAK